MKYRNFIPAGFVFAAALLLSACGFHLRGQIDLPEQLKAVHVMGGAAGSEMLIALKNKLAASGGQVVGREQAGTVLLISRDETQRRVLSVNAAGQPNEYELTYFLAYRLEDTEGGVLLGQQTLRRQRAYQYKPDNILANEEEERRIKKEMARAAVGQMLRRLSATLRKRAATDEPPAASTQGEGTP